ncbi:hypothetical protein CE91St30_23530 [Raoultibacter timonensis]|uniref:DUF4143 domain-containing protein n=1 Tax=Raoultibacter timonensis TaxID=1907662 RepID=A0ABN6MG95_9ACTN|nr:hypothetical protein CE91St30_23530 [Raoultibacter timonensis]BDF51624.1 hypothetical protein CE91St31_23540 [Raoultibacter timonensis]
MGASVETLIQDLETLGFLFESLVAHDLIAYAGATGAQVRHYHDDNDLEEDLVLEAPDGAWMPVEVKLGASQVDAAAKNLLALKGKMERGGYRPPSALLVAVGVFGIPKTEEAKRTRAPRFSILSRAPSVLSALDFADPLRDVADEVFHYTLAVRLVP